LQTLHSRSSPKPLAPFCPMHHDWDDEPSCPRRGTHLEPLPLSFFAGRRSRRYVRQPPSQRKGAWNPAERCLLDGALPRQRARTGRLSVCLGSTLALVTTPPPLSYDLESQCRPRLKAVLRLVAEARQHLHSNGSRERRQKASWRSFRCAMAEGRRWRRVASGLWRPRRLAEDKDASVEGARRFR
jgi:hypothetical protein